MISDIAPLRSSPDELYKQFIELHEKFLQHQQATRKLRKDPDYEENPEDNPVLEMAHEFESFTGAHLQVLMNLKAKRSLTEEDASICQKLEVMLKEERNTWRLAKALLKDQLLTGSRDNSHNSDRMDDSGSLQNGINDDLNMVAMNPGFSEEQIIGNFYVANNEIRRMQLVTDWLEANESNELDYKDEEDKVEFYSEGPTAWENTFHAMRTKYTIDIPELDMTINPDAGVELCTSMDPDAPIRTKKSLVHNDKEVEIRLFKHLFRFIRAGKLEEGQELAHRVKYHWLAAILDGWLPYSDPNLDEETLGTTAIHQPNDIRPISGNRKRDVWKQTCFRASRMHGFTSFEKATLGVLGGNLKSVLPVCNNWSDQLWARLKCSIDVKIERALRDPNIVPQENRLHTVDYPQEFYDNYQNLNSIFKTIKDLKIVSQYKEATIHQTVQKFFIVNDIDGLLNQLAEWSNVLDYDDNLVDNKEAISPHFLRFFAHIVLFIREIDLITSQDQRATRIIEAYIELLTQQKSIESVAHYTVFLPKENQTVSFAKLLATINDREERKQCLRVAKDSRLDVDEITQTVVEIIRDEPSLKVPINISTSDVESTKTTPADQRKIDALDYLLYLESKNYVAILHHGNILLRRFALQKKLDAVKETFLKLPANLSECVENQWRVHTNRDITPGLRNNLREFDSFRALLESQEELSQWSEWHHKKPEEPKKPANLSKFCDNVNYEQRLKQYQQDMDLWRELREIRTNALVEKITQMFYFPGGWMKDLTTDEGTSEDRLEQLNALRREFVPHMITICFNVLQLTNRHEDCLKVSHLLANDELKLYEEFSKTQLREFLDKICEVTKTIIKKLISEA